MIRLLRNVFNSLGWFLRAHTHLIPRGTARWFQDSSEYARLLWDEMHCVRLTSCLLSSYLSSVLVSKHYESVQMSDDDEVSAVILTAWYNLFRTNR